MDRYSFSSGWLVRLKRKWCLVIKKLECHSFVNKIFSLIFRIRLSSCLTWLAKTVFQKSPISYRRFCFINHPSVVWNVLKSNLVWLRLFNNYCICLWVISNCEFRCFAGLKSIKLSIVIDWNGGIRISATFTQ